ncbi:MAG: FosX/FosE/FosI family fosfomycin resistance thiol transferase [Eubacteriaceae bacterium]|nr:FosX/FosE/FosI family fosfomycin resistance thiol transferase [Eubacteriaceae bacterium]
MILSLSHITLIVRDINKTKFFLEKVFDAKEIYSSEEKTFSLYKEKYFLINDIWICIMQNDDITYRTYNHIAFEIPSDEVDAYIERIKEAGAEILPGRTRINGEGKSIYFYDFDNHLFELHTGNLKERLSAYLKS